MSHAVLDPIRSDADLGRRTARLTPGARLAAAVVLSAALIAGLVVGLVVQARDPVGAASSSGSVAAEAEQRRGVQLAVAAFAANLNDYSVRDIAGYKDRLMPLLTPGFAKSFGLAVDGIVAEVRSTKMTSTGQVVQTAVTSIGPDSATALVVADVSVTSTLGDRERHFRWKVSLVRESGGWLIDGFEPVA